MAEIITRYNVFIASPSGLEKEREAFRDTIYGYNEEIDEQNKGVLFKPAGWENILGGVGRPQSLINEYIEACDYFLLLLWDRWGTSPNSAGAGPYSSACEEEWYLALECLRASDKPMSQVLLFFKTVNPEALAKPEEQLRQVLEFRRNIEMEKQHLFTIFDEMDVFRRHLRRHLATWLQAHETGRHK